MGRKALILGVTGLVGSILLEEILSDDAYQEVITISRRKVTEHKKLKQVITELDNLENQLEHFMVNDVYCCLGTTIKKAGSQEMFKKVDYEFPLRAAQLARRAGAEQFLIISAMGADAKSRIFYNKVKGKIEEDLTTVGLKGLHIFRPSLLVGDRQEFRFGEKVAEWLFKPFAKLDVGFLGKYSPIKADTVAKAMKKIALMNDEGTHIYESDSIKIISK